MLSVVKGAISYKYIIAQHDNSALYAFVREHEHTNSTVKSEECRGIPPTMPNPTSMLYVITALDPDASTLRRGLLPSQQLVPTTTSSPL